MTHALARLSASVSRQINVHQSIYGGRPHMSAAHAQLSMCAIDVRYQCVRQRKATTHNWRIQATSAQGKHKSIRVPALPKPFRP
jgi:hypothetical protein